MYLIFLGTLKISVCTIVYPLQNCIIDKKKITWSSMLLVAS